MKDRTFLRIRRYLEAESAFEVSCDSLVLLRNPACSDIEKSRSQVREVPLRTFCPPEILRSRKIWLFKDPSVFSPDTRYSSEPVARHVCGSLCAGVKYHLCISRVLLPSPLSIGDVSLSKIHRSAVAVSNEGSALISETIDVKTTFSPPGENTRAIGTELSEVQRRIRIDLALSGSSPILVSSINELALDRWIF